MNPLLTKCREYLMMMSRLSLNKNLPDSFIEENFGLYVMDSFGDELEDYELLVEKGDILLSLKFRNDPKWVEITCNTSV